MNTKQHRLIYGVLALLAIVGIAAFPFPVYADDAFTTRPHQWTNTNTYRSKVIMEKGGTYYEKGYTVPWSKPTSGTSAQSGFAISGLESKLYLIDPSKAQSYETGRWSYGWYHTGLTKPVTYLYQPPAYYMGSGVTVILPTVSQQLDGVVLTFMNSTGTTGFSLYGTAVGSASGTTQGGGGLDWPFSVGDYITVRAHWMSAVSWEIVDWYTAYRHFSRVRVAKWLTGTTMIATNNDAYVSGTTTGVTNYTVDTGSNYQRKYNTGLLNAWAGLTGFFVPRSPVEAQTSLFVIDPMVYDKIISSNNVDADATGATNQLTGWGVGGSALGRMSTSGKKAGSGVTIHLPVPNRFIDGWEITLLYANGGGAVSGSSEVYAWCAGLPIGFASSVTSCGGGSGGAGATAHRLLTTGDFMTLRAAYNSAVCWWIVTSRGGDALNN